MRRDPQRPGGGVAARCHLQAPRERDETMTRTIYPPYPIWYVVTRREATQPLGMWGLRHILVCVAADMHDLDALYDKFAAPLANNPALSYGVETMIFAREVANPFRAGETAPDPRAGLPSFSPVAPTASDETPAAPDYRDAAIWE